MVEFGIELCIAGWRFRLAGLVAGHGTRYSSMCGLRVSTHSRSEVSDFTWV